MTTDASSPAPISPDESHRQEYWLTTIGLFFLELIKVAILAAVTIGLVRYFLFKPFYVKGQSMEPNFMEHDYLIIDELSYRFHTPERGDVIVFQAPTVPGEFYLKRVIALPGERVKIENNKIVVYNETFPQGVVMNEDYLSEPTVGATALTTLGPDEYFVLGDNRDASYDSRRFGPIKRDAIIGRTWVRGWPVSRVSIFPEVTYNL